MEVQQIHMSSTRPKAARFSGVRDFVVTPLVWGFTLFVPVTVAFFIWQWTSPFVAVGLALVLMVLVTIGVLRVLQWVAPIGPGVYSFSNDQPLVYRWTLWSYIYHCNLVSLGLAGGLLPIPLRKLFHASLGANTGDGIISIAGLITDPFLTTLEKGSTVGQNAMLLGHLVMRSSQGDALVLGRIRVGKNAIIGAGSVIMPGVDVGEGAVINALSLVPTNTKIPPFEVWGGNPAKKVNCL